MLTKLRKTSPQRHRVGSSLTIALVLTVATVAWAANPDSESASAAVDEQFAFDIEVTVDGRSQTGNLILTGGAAISSVGGQPRMLASETLRLEHRDDESGWAAEVTISRMADEKFSVTSTIRKNDEVVATPRMIIGNDSPASIETRDSETGEVAYRMVLTPVDAERAEPVDVSTGNSAVLMLRIDDAGTVARPVRWPVAPGDAARIGMSNVDGQDPWNALVGLRRLDGDDVELCLEGFHPHGATRSIMEEKGCMIFSTQLSSNASMRGEFEETGISWRLDMFPLARQSK